MSKIMKNKWVKASTAIATIFSSAKAPAIDLQSKIKNADRTDFNTISSPFKKKTGQYSIIGELSDTRQPLILKQANGKNQTLIEGLQAFELSFLYELTDSIQLGILVPGEKPYGLIGPYNEAKNYLSNILIEPKVYISNNIALIPVYYIPAKNPSKINISGQPTDINFGNESGAYGLKLSMGMNHDSGIKTAYQIGAIIAPESKFRDIDQTMKVQFGAAVKKELSGGLKLLAEAYGEKYKSNMPLEALAMIEYSNDKFMVRVGGGTGDIQGSGSNTTRMLANFSYYFGEEPKKSEPEEVKTPKLSDKPLTPEEYEAFKKKVEDTEDELINEKLKEMENQNRLKQKIDEPVPDQSSLNYRTIPLVSVLVRDNSKVLKFQSAMDGDSDEDLDFVKNLSNEEFESLFSQEMNGLDFKNTVARSIASATQNNLLARIEDAHVTPTAILEIKKRQFHWSEPKAKYVLLNLRRTNLSLRENIDLYKKLKLNNEDTTKVENEINWGLRVFKRNLNSWNLLISSYMEETKQNIDRLDLNSSIVSVNYTSEALELLGKTETKIENEIQIARKNELLVGEDYKVVVASRLNIRKNPKILLNNVAGQLANGDVVRPKNAEIINSFVEVEVIKSQLFENPLKIEPLFVHYKYLIQIEKENPKLKENPVLSESEEMNNHSLMDTLTEVSKLNNQNPQNFEDVANVLGIIQNSEKEVANKKANTIEVVPVEVPKMEEVNQEIDKLMIESKKEVITVEDNKISDLSEINPQLEKKASKIEIVYEETPEEKPEVKQKKSKKLPEKKVQSLEVKKDTVISSPETAVENKTKEVEVKSEIVENKSEISLSQETKIESAPQKLEVVDPVKETKLDSEPVNAQAKETTKSLDNPKIEEIKLEKSDESKTKVKEEMDSLDKIIEMKTKKESSVIEVKTSEPKIKQEEVVEVKKEETKVVEEVKSKSVFDKVIEQKTVELKNEKSKLKDEDPSKVEPLQLQEDYPADEVQKGPKF